MTVKYTDSIASRGGFGSFWKLLLKWRGSVYKMVWQDMAVYIILYYVISLIYRFGLSDDSRTTFEKLVIHCARFRNLIPVSFVLGFYVSLVVNRWWGTYQSLPWPDTCAILAATHIPGLDTDSREVRARIMRYVNLAIAMTFSMVSPVVQKKLPTPMYMVEAGYLTENEMGIMDEQEKRTSLHKTWIPIMWACKTVDRARHEGLIRSNTAQKALTEEILNVRGRCGGLMGWNTYNIPLVYTQVVTIAVYSFFLFSIIGEQFLDPTKEYSDHQIDFVIPIFALLQLFFYIGWIKVAEALLNPFGEDDHDFEFLPLLERHLEMSALLSDPVPSELPEGLQPETISEKPQLIEPLMEGSKSVPNNLDFVIVKKSPVGTMSSSATFETCQQNS